LDFLFLIWYNSSNNKFKKKKMTFEEYQIEARKTAIYPDKDNNFIYPTLGLAGEAGEVAEKIKKVLRDNQGIVSEEKKIEITKELGDVLWYVANLSQELGISLDEVAQKNIEKLKSRQQRDELHGSGDNR
jgi:NTP pyrophosphatase (non-canonical NTP hydrolase)